jgi:hypothetical protein
MRTQSEPPQTGGNPPTTWIYHTVSVCSAISGFAANFPVCDDFHFSPKIRTMLGLVLVRKSMILLFISKKHFRRTQIDI